MTSLALSVDLEFGLGGSSIPNGNVDSELLLRKNAVEPLAYLADSFMPNIARPNLMAVDLPVSEGLKATVMGHPPYSEMIVS